MIVGGVVKEPLRVVESKMSGGTDVSVESVLEGNVVDSCVRAVWEVSVALVSWVEIGTVVEVVSGPVTAVEGEVSGGTAVPVEIVVCG